MIWFLNGRWLNDQEAVVPINDLAVLRGIGVFDFLITYAGKPFRLEEHIDRLYNSARLLDLTIPSSKKQLAQEILTAVQKNKLPSVTVRILVTGGVSTDNFLPQEKSSLAILIQERVPYPQSCYQAGIKLKTCEFLRFMPGAKHIDYLAGAMAKKKAYPLGYLEILYTHQGQVLECSTSNFFIIKGQQLITPQDKILPGITRQIILELAQDHLQVVKRPLSMEEVKDADEAFLSASDKEIMPVVQIDDHQINDGTPGKQTLQLMSDFRKLSTK